MRTLDLSKTRVRELKLSALRQLYLEYRRERRALGESTEARDIPPPITRRI